MTHSRICSALRCAPIVAAAVITFGVPAAAKCQENRVGEVIIVGNVYTDDRFIRAPVRLYPGQPLSLDDLRQAEQNLRRVGLFRSATVSVLYTPGSFKDILIKVEERPWNWLQFATIDLLIFRNTLDHTRLESAAHLVRVGMKDWLSQHK